MNKYHFTNNKGEYTLEFPNDSMALNHAKLNHATKVMVFDVVIAEVKQINAISRGFVITDIGKQRLAVEITCHDCG